ncbi:hypothetical protein [Pseudonocardia sp. DLS-67]
MPTWFTVALVTPRIARSAREEPRKRQMSPRAHQLAGLVEGDLFPEHRIKLVRRGCGRCSGSPVSPGSRPPGVVIGRSERQRRAYPPEEIRARLHERVAALEEAPPPG